MKRLFYLATAALFTSLFLVPTAAADQGNKMMDHMMMG